MCGGGRRVGFSDNRFHRTPLFDTISAPLSVPTAYCPLLLRFKCIASKHKPVFLPMRYIPLHRITPPRPPICRFCGKYRASFPAPHHTFRLWILVAGSGVWVGRRKWFFRSLPPAKSPNPVVRFATVHKCNCSSRRRCQPPVVLPLVAVKWKQEVVKSPRRQNVCSP